MKKLKAQSSKCKTTTQNSKLKNHFFIFAFFCSFVFLFSCSFVLATEDFAYPLDAWQPCSESKFGSKRAKNVYHLGDDVLVPHSTPVKNIADGIVKHIGIHSRFGTVILIEHQLSGEEKIVSLYGHLRRKDVQVSKNQFVNKGEIVGYVGATGKENGYWLQEHLHFGIRKGEYVDVKTTWVYWGYGNKKEMSYWYNPDEFLTSKLSGIVDPNNIAKILVAPASNRRANLKLFDGTSNEVANSDIFASRYGSAPGADVAVAKLDTEGNLGLVVGLGRGTLPYVKIYNKKDKTLFNKFLAFSEKNKSGLRIATGDITGDGISEILVSPQGKTRNQVRIFDLQGNRIKTIFPFDKKRKIGLDIAAGDLDGDKIDEIIIGAGAGIKPFVKIYNSNGTLLKTFRAYDKNFRGGVRVAAGDIDADGLDEIITGAGEGGGPHVRVFEADGKPRYVQFFAFDKNFRGGVDVATSDIDNNGKDEIIMAQASGGSRVKVFRYNLRRTILADFEVFGEEFEGGVNIAGIP